MMSAAMVVKTMVRVRDCRVPNQRSCESRSRVNTRRQQQWTGGQDVPTDTGEPRELGRVPVSGR